MVIEERSGFLAERTEEIISKVVELVEKEIAGKSIPKDQLRTIVGNALFSVVGDRFDDDLMFKLGVELIVAHRIRWPKRPQRTRR